ncbi:MAG: right-handed parallel beta-helix repeat-containing protein, partial [Chloroflexota bacterium]
MWSDHRRRWKRKRGHHSRIKCQHQQFHNKKQRDNGSCVSSSGQSNLIVVNNNITNFYIGANFYGSSSVNLSNNILMFGWYAGAVLQSASNAVVSCNEIANITNHGIDLDGFPAVTVSGNNIVDNNASGIYLTTSEASFSDVIISGNNVTRNEHG